MTRNSERFLTAFNRIIDTMHAFAEPHESIVERIEKIEKDITQPKLVIPLFSREVICFQTEERLSNVLHSIHENGFSKFPVNNNSIFTVA